MSDLSSSSLSLISTSHHLSYLVALHNYSVSPPCVPRKEFALYKSLFPRQDMGSMNFHRPLRLLNVRLFTSANSHLGSVIMHNITRLRYMGSISSCVYNFKFYASFIILITFSNICGFLLKNLWRASCQGAGFQGNHVNI